MKITGALTTAAFLVFFSAAAVLPAEIPFTVLPWNGYKAAVSLTYDDGDPIHLDLVIPEMKKRGMTGTFFLISDKIQRIEDWKKAAKSGMEIGNHSAGHRHLKELVNNEDILYETEYAGSNLREWFWQQ